MTPLVVRLMCHVCRKANKVHKITVLTKPVALMSFVTCTDYKTAKKAGRIVSK